MTKRFEIDLPEGQAKFVEKTLAQGDFASPSAVDHALSMLRRNEEALVDIRARLERSAASDADVPLSSAMDRLRTRYAG